MRIYIYSSEPYILGHIKYRIAPCHIFASRDHWWSSKVHLHNALPQPIYIYRHMVSVWLYNALCVHVVYAQKRLIVRLDLILSTKMLRCRGVEFGCSLQNTCVIYIHIISIDPATTCRRPRRAFELCCVYARIWLCMTRGGVSVGEGGWMDEASSVCIAACCVGKFGLVRCLAWLYRKDANDPRVAYLHQYRIYAMIDLQYGTSYSKSKQTNGHTKKKLTTYTIYGHGHSAR